MVLLIVIKRRYFWLCKIQYSTDGTTFKDLNKEVYGEYASSDVTNIEIEDVNAVRYVCSYWYEKQMAGQCEFTVVTQPAEEEQLLKK